MTFVLTLLLTLQDEQIDNPEYKRWASCAVGSWVTKQVESSLGVGHSVSDVTVTLKEVGKDYLVLEETSAVRTGGALFLGEPGKVKVRSKIPTSAAPEKVTREGKEDLDIDGKKITCRWEERGSGPFSKMWLSDEIPGGVVKTQLVDDGTVVFKQIVSKWGKK